MAYYLCVYNGHRQLLWLDILADYDFLHTLQFIFLYLNTADNNFERTLWLGYSWSHLNRDSALIQRGQLWLQEMIWSSYENLILPMVWWRQITLWSFYVIHENVTVTVSYKMTDYIWMIIWFNTKPSFPVQSEWL